jgi:hypothetical protein
MTFVKRMLGALGLTCVLGFASGCSDYTYFNVDVFADQRSDHSIDNDVLSQSGDCSIAVFAGNTQIETSRTLRKVTSGSENPCSREALNKIQGEALDDSWVKDLGVMDYSTSRQSGKLTFVVTMHSGNTGDPDVGQGKVEGEVSPGKVLNLNLILYSCRNKDSNKYECEFSVNK